jgi:hypothetical protein
MTAQPARPEALAAALAARLIHDFSGPASGVVTGLDLEATSGDPALKASGLALAAESARALLVMLEISRVAFGGLGASQTAETLERLAAACFAGKRARLTWTPETAIFDAAVSRVVLLLCQIAVAGLGAGGVAELSSSLNAGEWRLRVDCRGPRAALPAEAVAGLLAGETTAAGVAGRGAPARYLHAVAATSGGRATHEALAGGFAVAVTLLSDPTRPSTTP